VLGFGEAGNFPAAIKSISEWFPKKERALATGIFNSGTNVGAIIAPITVPWIADNLGWEAAFLIIGGIGLLWLVFWFWLYEIPTRSKRVAAAEIAYINADTEKVESTGDDIIETKVSWFKLFEYKQTWAFSFGKFMTDGVWWFFLFWLPAYMKAQYGMVGMDVTFPLAVLYMMSSIGSITGGWFPMYFINKGYEPYAARMKAMLTIAVFPLIVLSAQYMGVYSYWWPVVIIGIGTAAHQAWSANIFTTVSDMFPKKAIGSVIGIGGMAGAFGGIVVNETAGRLFDTYRFAGIAKSWVQAQAGQLGDFVEKIRSMHLVNKSGDVINLNQVELGNLPKEVIEQLQAIDPGSFQLLKSLQAPIVQGNMTIAYTIVFAFCALAYLMAWFVMHALVPKFKKVELD